MRDARVQFRWFGWLLRLAGVAYLFWWVTDTSYVLWLFFAALFLFYPELMGVLRHVVSRRYGRVYTYTLTDAGVGIRTAITNLEFGWGAVKSIRQIRPGWVVRLPGGAGFVLPKDAMTPDQTAEWQAFLTARTLTTA
jgi:hypothetical protein